MPLQNRHQNRHNVCSSLVVKSTATKTVLAFGAFSAILFSSLLPLAPAKAQTLPTLPIQFNPDELENPGRPGDRRRGGGSRGGCQADIPLTAIAYANSRTIEELGVPTTVEAVGALTTQAQPMLWFYLPQPIADRAPQLIIKNSRDQDLFQGQLVGATGQSGIVGVSVPINIELGEAYHWFLLLDCDETESTSVDGWIERRAGDPALSRTFNQANARNRAALYANYGFLQDALSELAMLRLSSPGDEAIAQDWTALLTTLGLSDLAAAPVLDCCQVVEASQIEEPEAISEPELVEPVEPVEPAAVEPVPEDVPQRPTSLIERAREEDGSPRDR